MHSKILLSIDFNVNNEKRSMHFCLNISSPYISIIQLFVIIILLIAAIFTMMTITSTGNSSSHLFPRLFIIMTFGVAFPCMSFVFLQFPALFHFLSRSYPAVPANSYSQLGFITFLLSPTIVFLLISVISGALWQLKTREWNWQSESNYS